MEGHSSAMPQNSLPLVILRQRILRNAKDPNEGSMYLAAEAQLPPLALPSIPCHSAEHRDEESAVLNVGTDGAGKTLVWGGHSCPPLLTLFVCRQLHDCRTAHSNVAPFATLE